MSGDASGAPCGILVEQVGELADDGTAKLVDIGDCHRPPVIARHVMADTDGEKLDRRAVLDIGNHFAKMLFKICLLYTSPSPRDFG